MSKHLLIVHGRDFKPDKEFLEEMYKDALLYGFEREFGKDSVEVKSYSSLKSELVYYGKLSNDFLTDQAGRTYDMDFDKNDRISALKDLKRYGRDEFTEEKFKNVPGRSWFKKFLATMLGTPLALLGLSRYVIHNVAPDMEHYWDLNSFYANNVRNRLAKRLEIIFEEDKDADIMIVSHSLGTLITYDVLWQFSYNEEHKKYKDRKISHLITAGCPLGDLTVKRNLKSRSTGKPESYPTNIIKWTNIAAVNDYISYDDRLGDDYSFMTIEDMEIYNPSVRFDKGKNARISNPHHFAGYLMHPKTIKVVASWL